GGRDLRRPYRRRVPRGLRRRLRGGRAPGEGRELPAEALRLVPLEAADRAAPQAAVVHRRGEAGGALAGEAPVATAGDAGGGRRGRHPDPAAPRGEDLLPLDRQPPRLVHLAPDLVGAPGAGLVPRRAGDVRRPPRTGWRR